VKILALAAFLEIAAVVESFGLLQSFGDGLLEYFDRTDGPSFFLCRVAADGSGQRIGASRLIQAPAPVGTSRSNVGIACSLSVSAVGTHP
jgi:hypothetical protein